MSKKHRELTISQVAEIFRKPEPTLRARLRKFGQDFLHHRFDENDRYIVIRDELFEKQLTSEQLLPRRSPRTANEDLSHRLNELEKKFSELERIVERLQRTKK